MLSTSKSSFLVTSIVGSILRVAVGGPLDCISGPCVTVEGVGRLKLRVISSNLNPIPNQPHLKAILSHHNSIPTQSHCNILHIPIPTQSHSNAIIFQRNPIPMHLLRKAARQLGTHPVVTSSDQPVHGNSFWWDDCWWIQVIWPKHCKCIIFTVLHLQQISAFQICTPSAKSAS